MTLDVLERMKVKIRQADPYDKTGDATKGGRGYKILLHQNIQKSIIFTCNGIISSILDYRSQLKYFKVQNHEHFNDYLCCFVFYLNC